ncbi:MAG TPA: ATP-binding cassette domain-containing protein [Methanolinea sp.]|nr:ATP-binding cassette domain-containing protein [Methanolinea sp.]
MITLEDVSYRYQRGGRDAVSGISLSVSPGECLMITGPSGAGKTTLCMAASGILEHEFGGEKRGRVTILGKDVREYPGLPEIASHVSVVFDDPEAQLIFTTVEEEILSALERSGLSPAEIGQRLASILEITRLAALKDRPPHALSGGQKQRVALAAALALGTDILILDEPTAELDEEGTASIVSVLRDLKAQGKTILLTEHKYSHFRDLVDRLVVMEGGRFRAIGTPCELITDRSVAEIVIPDFSGIRSSFPCRPHEGENPVISVRDLEFLYGDVPALAGVSLDVYPGEFVAIVGENGSGKTTLIKHFIGLLHATRGSVTVDGKDAKVTPVSELAHSVGLVFQNPDHMFFADTVAGEVMFGITNLGIPEPEAVLGEVLSRCRLSGARDLYPRWLSRGERQRLAIACVLAMQPKVIVLDEPTTGLDGKESREVMEILRQLQAEGRAIVMVTHNHEMARECADRVVTMRAGRIVSDTRNGA